MLKILDGKVALITGCSGGIGRETAIRFAEEGASLAICARTASKLEETAEACRQRDAQVLAVVCDITDKTQLENLVHQTTDQFGRIDILINNAVNAKPCSPFLEQTEADLMTVFESGYLATWRLMRLCYPYLKESKGKIINFASPAGLTGAEGYAAYASIKEAIRGLTMVTAREWGKDGINVNCISPTAITPKMQTIIDSFPEGQRKPETLGFKVPAIGRIGTAYEDLTPILVFLASEASNYITGQTLRADGGGTIF